MPPSYRLINYSLRPAKAVERKMLCDLFRRFEPFGGIAFYRYIGFGSIYFTDFQLFHQSLNISDMISIERDTMNELRFEFNKPYRCVTMEMGDSNVVLPRLDWSRRCAVWLDYEDILDSKILADIETIITKAPSGSVLIVSINAEPLRKSGASFDDVDNFRLISFSQSVGEHNVPSGLSGAQLRGGDIEKSYRRVIINAIERCLAAINGPLPSDQKKKIKQLVNISYADDARMLTLGIILFEERERTLVDKCAFEDLHFFRDSDLSYEIKAPRLTQKEVRSLNMLLPKSSAVPVELPGVPKSDLDDYAEIYRYYPSFVESFLG